MTADEPLRDAGNGYVVAIDDTYDERNSSFERHDRAALRFAALERKSRRGKPALTDLERP